MILLDISPQWCAIRYRWRLQDRRQIQSVGLPVRNRLRAVEHLDVSDCLIQRAEPERREELPYLFCDVLEESDDEFRLAGEATSQLRVLGRDANRTGVEMAKTLLAATRHDEL